MVKNAETSEITRRVLVVEDDSTLAFALSEMLTDAGYDISVTTNGDEALGVFRAKHCDIIITDLKMPGMSGIELLRRAKQISPSTEVIVVTAYGSLETAIEALRLHAFDFILKPYPMNRLMESVRKALEWSSKDKSVAITNRPIRPVHGIITGNENIIVSWDMEADEKMTYMLDVIGLNKCVTLAFVDMPEELIKRRQDMLPEVRGFIRNGFFRKKPQSEVGLELKEYMEKAYGIINNWRFLIAEHNEKEGSLKIYCEGAQNHIIYDSNSRRAKPLLGDFSSGQNQRSHNEYKIKFTDGDSLLLLPAKTYEYIDYYLGKDKLISIIENTYKTGEGDIAERIRNSIKGDNGAVPPGVLVVTSKQESIPKTNRLVSIKTNLSVR